MSTQPPVEDISAIVGRFQAWAESRATEGIRELTYDEATRARRRRDGESKLSQHAEKPAAAAIAQRRNTVKSAKPKKSTARQRHTKRPRSEPPAFRQVLAENVSILPTSPHELTIVERKTATLSLRISSSEHVLLKKRAAEAGLPVSCYLRSCIFEVEELRTRVDHLLAVKETPLRQLPGRSSLVDQIASFFRNIFSGGKNALSLRA